jgi:hypothetical protein
VQLIVGKDGHALFISLSGHEHSPMLRVASSPNSRAGAGEGKKVFLLQAAQAFNKFPALTIRRLTSISSPDGLKVG